MGEGIVHLGHWNGRMSRDKLHSVCFGQVFVWPVFDTDVEDVKKAGLSSPEPSKELMVSRFNDKKDDCSDEASWRWRWRDHWEVIEGSDRRRARSKRKVEGTDVNTEEIGRTSTLCTEAGMDGNVLRTD